MHRLQKSRKHHSSSFTNFVARLQRTFSSKSIKSSTRIVEQQKVTHPPKPTPLPTFSNYNSPQFQLSQILYDPSRQVEYLSEIEEKTNSDISEQSLSVDDADSCYDSMNDLRNDRLNLSQMNVSLDDIYNHYSQPMKLLKLPNSLDTARFHSTAINEMGNF